MYLFMSKTPVYGNVLIIIININSKPGKVMLMCTQHTLFNKLLIELRHNCSLFDHYWQTIIGCHGASCCNCCYAQICWRSHASLTNNQVWKETTTSSTGCCLDKCMPSLVSLTFQARSQPCV